jgi:quercetin dioxygenase-like cupin family protein
MADSYRPSPTGHDPGTGPRRLDLLATARVVLQEAADAPAGRAARTLAAEAPLRLNLLALRSGAYLSEHRAPGALCIQVLIGDVEVEAAGAEPQRLSVGQALLLGRGVTHAVRAHADSVLLLAIAGEGSS